MAKTLDVYLHDKLVGHLIQDEGGQTVFKYTQACLDRPGATALSVSLPLQKERFSRNECRGFFAGILPDGNKREIIARNLGISARNDFAMLERIGGECAGAVTFIPRGPAHARLSTTAQSPPKELADIFKELPRRPLLAGEEGVRLSLAGAQDKIAVRIEGARSLPATRRSAEHAHSEACRSNGSLVSFSTRRFTMQLAAATGLPAARVEDGAAEQIEYLSVERYDRTHIQSGTTTKLDRLHQEDFCQALNIGPEMKYQKEGGPSFKQCFALLREVSSAPVD